jgi:hypothetical protein
MRKVKVPKKAFPNLDQLILDFMNLSSIDRMRRIMYCMYNVNTYDEETIKIDPYLIPMFRRLKSMYPTVGDEVLLRATILNLSK